MCVKFKRNFFPLKTNTYNFDLTTNRKKFLQKCHLEHLNVFALNIRGEDYGNSRGFSISVIVISPLMYFNNDSVTVKMS